MGHMQQRTQDYLLTIAKSSSGESNLGHYEDNMLLDDNFEVDHQINEQVKVN